MALAGLSPRSEPASLPRDQPAGGGGGGSPNGSDLGNSRSRETDLNTSSHRHFRSSSGAGYQEGKARGSMKYDNRVT